MLNNIEFKLTGVSPLMCHNGHLANPTNPFVLALKEVTKKRTKTDADYEAMRSIEWHGGMYWNKDEKPIVPGSCIEAMLQNAAKKQKLGLAFKAGVFCMKDSLIDYDGPDTPKKLYSDDGFVDQQMVVIQRVRVLRTRPIFYSWSLNTEVSFNNEVANEREIVTAMETAGSIIGLCDYRPKYGRFEVEYLGAAA